MGGRRPGGSASFLRGLPVHVLQDDGPKGREVVGLLQRLGLRTLGDLADLPGDAVEHRLGAYGAAAPARARGEDRAPRGSHSPAQLEADVSFETPLDSVEAITFSVRTTAERFITQLAHHQLVATGVRVEAESDGVVCSSRAWLHPRHFTARDLVDRVHWQLQGAGVGGSLRGASSRARCAPRSTEGQVRARGGRAGSRSRRGALGHAPDDLVERGVARVQGMVGFDAVRRPVLQGRSRCRRRASRWCRGPARRRPATGRPTVAGTSAGPGSGPGVRDPAGRRGRRRRGPRRTGHRSRRRDRRAATVPGRGRGGACRGSR